eukprot:CAMPEP_0197853908 /NCGR_PEP_ID=MMETSP1438-20131217/23643_1 /TAXON_ID=1461541 /ORGANISM="Pterosperma sp., Strain CCMP1384" /LENGTH=43 /DNA_ID= /DNA_START= /DNA_END= /DNA_ORIENTATION=
MAANWKLHKHPEFHFAGTNIQLQVLIGSLEADELNSRLQSLTR